MIQHILARERKLTLSKGKKDKAKLGLHWEKTKILMYVIDILHTPYTLEG